MNYGVIFFTVVVSFLLVFGFFVLNEAESTNKKCIEAGGLTVKTMSGYDCIKAEKLSK